ncbi:unnamed protein product [Closterium sp. NIES-65]|nr:unnamed protein product [Closterium sp. NIES-65]
MYDSELLPVSTSGNDGEAPGNAGPEMDQRRMEEWERRLDDFVRQGANNRDGDLLATKYPGLLDPKMRVWPMPRQFKSSNGKDVVRPAIFSPFSQLTVSFGKASAADEDSSRDLVTKAYNRYHRIIFAHEYGDDYSELDDSFASGTSQGGKAATNSRATVVVIEQIDVQIARPGEPLDVGVDESYSLSLGGTREPGAALIKANTSFGALRALETLSQLCRYHHPSRLVTIHGVPLTVEDSPRFHHRGLLIDTARHFLPVVEIERVLDAMSYAKLNVLHWHLVDAQSFPIETPSFPRLWEGAFSQAERYTLKDAKHIVRYAAARGIVVIPEIDTPAHATSWEVGYPVLYPSPGPSRKESLYAPRLGEWDTRALPQPHLQGVPPVQPPSLLCVPQFLSLPPYPLSHPSLQGGGLPRALSQAPPAKSLRVCL